MPSPIHPYRVSRADDAGSVDCRDSATMPRMSEGRQNRQQSSVATAETIVSARLLPLAPGRGGSGNGEP